MSRNIVETIVGALVIVVAGAFTTYAFTHSGSARPTGYELVARFDRVDGIKRGSDVTLSGVKIGTVTSIALDPASYVAVVRLAIDNSIKVQADSSAKVTSESLLGGSLILIEACCDNEKFLAPGSEFTKTQGYRSLVDLLVATVAGSVNNDGKKK